jgi:hypothetical protein
MKELIGIKVIAYDPGITVGYAEGHIDDGLMTIVSGESKASHGTLWASLGLMKPDVIVCESFEFRRNARDNLELFSCELIGVIRLYAEINDCLLEMQTAAQGKGFFSDNKLRAAKLYRMGKPHANDAIRHLLHWYQFGAGYKFNTRGYESGI